jgi:hypothetical protein
MADIPDITPSKPIWPVRPDERRQAPKQQPQPDAEQPEKRRQRDDDDRSRDDGHIDEYA